MRSLIKSVSIALLGALLLPVLPANSQTAPPPGIIAIDILIQPDTAMLEKARAINAELRQNYPQGYALDATHLPHVTLVQRYIRAQDFDAVKTAIAAVLKAEPLSSLQFTASSYTVSTWGNTGILLLNVERTAQLQRLEESIRTTVQPYAVRGGTAEAFVHAAAEQIDPKTIQWVEDFVPAHSGEHYEPHITLGLAHPDFLAKLKAEPFLPIAFRPAEVAIYQLGNVGTAQRRLAGWALSSQPSK